MTAVLIVTVVLALINLYLVLSVRQKLGGQRHVFRGVAIIFILFYALQLVAPWLDWSRTPLEHAFSGVIYNALVQGSYLALGVLSCLLFYSFVVDIVWLVGRLFMSPRIARFYGYVALSFVVFATMGSVAMGLHDAGKTDVAEVDLPIKSLPPSFEGFKIAQISDLHIGPHLKQPFVQRMADQIKTLSPDLIVLTGDVADGRVPALAEDVAPLAQLSAPFGKYYITGNHEYYWGAEAWTQKLSELGFQVLMNDAVTFDRDGGLLALAGVPDLTSLRAPGSVQTDIVGTAQKIAPLASKILLSHQAKTIDEARRAGFDAQLSGHSHAGQYFPFTWVIKFVTPYVHGLYNVEGVSLYVNKGAGFWGPPLRSGGPGEITLLTLHRAE